VQRLIGEKSPGAEAQVTARSDLAPDGKFGEQWLALAGDRVLVCAPDGVEATLLVELPLADISEVEIENLVGGAVLRAVLKDHKVDLIAFTNAQADEFGRVRSQLDAAAKGKPIPQPEVKPKRCPTCGLVLGEDTRVCPRCSRRGATLRRLLGYARPYRGRLILTGGLMLAGAAFGLLPPYLTKLLVDRVLAPKSPADQLFARQHGISLLGWLVLALAASSILSTVLQVWRNRLTGWLGGRVSFDIRATLYEKLQWLSLRYYDRHSAGAIISRLTQDSGGVQDLLAFGLPFLVTNLITIVGVSAVIFVKNWQLAALAIVPALLVSMGTRPLWEKMRKAFHAFWYRWGRYHSLVNDALNRVKIIKAFSQQPMELQRYSIRNADLMGASVYAEQTWGTIFPLLWLLIGSGSLLVWYFGGVMTVHGTLTLGDLMMFLGYLGMLYGPLNFLTNVVQWVSRALTAADRIFEVLDAEFESEKTKGEVVPDRIHGAVEFRNVVFGYEKHQPVIKDVSFKTEPGHMLGLVGKSGVGKSTVINLLCRFYDVDEGEILVDGINLRDLSLWAYRGRLGAVLQEPFLIAGTIAENIAYGKPEASFEEIMAAAKLANAHDFIVNKPDGYDEQVGEHGHRLSAGEKQRVCIARAVLHDPAILILDEATANVDLETEEQIQQAIARLVEGRTTFAIAHRLSTLRNADKLMVMEEGKVVEFGTHQELEEKKGVYYNLLDLHRKTSMMEAVDG
jgi:ATP-binding cassette subfamily B protein